VQENSDEDVAVMMCCKKIACKVQRKILNIDTDQVKDVQANNEYAEPIDHIPMSWRVMIG